VLLVARLATPVSGKGYGGRCVNVSESITK
jgi:hypothetical protein